MIIELIELIKSWPSFAQLVGIIVMSGLATLVVLALIGFVGDFINGSLPVLLRGYNPYTEREEDAPDEKR